MGRHCAGVGRVFQRRFRAGNEGEVIPQLIMLFLMAVSIGIEMSYHGETKPKKYNVWSTLVAVALNIAILHWGGFFNVFFQR